MIDHDTREFLERTRMHPDEKVSIVQDPRIAILANPDDPTKGVRGRPGAWSSVNLKDGVVTFGFDNCFTEAPSHYVPLADLVDRESARRARALREDGVNPAERMALPRTAVEQEVLLNSNVDIPLDRMAREFRKRAGRAFGLGDDAMAKTFRDLCDQIEALSVTETQRGAVRG